MSARLVDCVWSSSLPAWLKPYAAVMAGFANDDGSRVYPSIALVAWKVGVSERRAQGAVSRLTALGVLRVVCKHAPGRPTRYVFEEDALPSRPVFVAKQLGFEFSTGVHRTPTSEHLTSTSEKPDVSDSKPDVHVTRSVKVLVSDPSEYQDPALIAPHDEEHDDKNAGSPSAEATGRGRPGSAEAGAGDRFGRAGRTGEGPPGSPAATVGALAAAPRALDDRPPPVDYPRLTRMIKAALAQSTGPPHRQHVRRRGG